MANERLALDYLMIEIAKFKLPVPHGFNLYLQKVYDEAKKIELEQRLEGINDAIKIFEELKEKENSLRDIVYLDGVLAVLDSCKEKITNKK